LSNFLDTAASGLLAFQRAIATTSHNIANARTEGYSRQRTDLEARPPNLGGGQPQPGKGTFVSGIDRLHDGFAAARVLESTSAHARETTHHGLASRIDNLMADESLGLGPALSGLNAALEDAAAEPSSTAAREVVLAAADDLDARFGTMQGQLDAIGLEAQRRLQAEAVSINDLAKGVAELNARIVTTTGRGRTSEANDLLDQRDQLIKEIAAHVDVEPIPQDDGALHLFIGNGTALVLGNRANTLGAVSDPSALGGVRLEIAGGGGSSQSLGNVPLGGNIGGLRDFATETLEPIRHRIGRLALVMTDRLNVQHASGLDARGEFGGTLLSIGEPEALAGEANTGGATLEATVTDASNLAASDYLLRWDGASLEATRRSDGQRTSGPSPLAVDGLEISLSGVPAVGDTFLVSATGGAAGSLSRAVTDTEALAFARALIPGEDSANTGTATLAPPTVSDPADTALRTPIDIVFTADDTYDVVERGGGATLASGVTLVAGDPIAFNGWSSSIEGSPRSGDVLRIDPNTAGTGDNGNALALVGLQDEPSIDGSTTPIEEQASLVSFVGGRARTLQTRSSALETLRDDALARAETVSGVDLDEEAIDLTRYEQAYQASAQAISVAETLFQSILGAVRR